MDTTQYFEMWDTAYNTIKSLAPSALTVGPDFAADPAQNPTEWSEFLAHVKSAGTAPSEISDHLEGDGDDPVAVAQSINSDLSTAGISARPLSANEFLPENDQTAGQTAWYLARFAQSGYANAARGNWASCCVNPYLAGTIVSNGNGGYSYTGQWWAFRTYADLTGSLVSTSGEVGNTAISAAEDSSHRRAVAIVGDADGYTGAASVTFTGLSSVSWLANGGNVNVTVYRIPDQSPLNSPDVVTNEIVSASSGSITVPITFAAANDAFAIYLTPGFAAGFSSTMANTGTGQCMDENDWTTRVRRPAPAVDLQRRDQPGVHLRADRVRQQHLPHPADDPGLLPDVNGDSTASGAAIIQYPCNYNSNEEFTLTSVGTNEYHVIAVNSGLCVAPAGGSTTVGAALVQVACSSADTTWTITE